MPLPLQRVQVDELPQVARRFLDIHLALTDGASGEHVRDFDDTPGFAAD